MKSLIGIFLLLASLTVGAQSSYEDSMKKFISDYVTTHEVVKGNDREHLSFFPINKYYRVDARFEAVKDSKWFNMPTSGALSKPHRVYGYLYFTINDTAVKLAVYQSQNLLQMEKYRTFLFLPFTDLSSGEETYAVGRYIDLLTTDIVNNQVVIDFNKAYNPYCAYSEKYSCPFPPKGNVLKTAVRAGEKNYHH